MKHKKAKARWTPLQIEVVFGVSSALCVCFKTLAFPLGGLRGVQCVHMWTLKAGTVFPSLPWLHMSYGIQLRPLKNKAIPSIFLCSLAKFSARVTGWALRFSAALSVVCMYPLSLWPLGINECRPACWLTGQRACWITASQLVREGKNRERGKERKRERMRNGVAWVWCSSDIKQLTLSLHFPPRLIKTAIFGRVSTATSFTKPSRNCFTDKQWWWSSTVALTQL